MSVSWDDVRAAFSEGKETAMRNYKVTLESGRATVVSGCAATRITKAGILVLYSTDPGKAHGGDVVSDNVLASYSAGAWLAVEDVGTAVRCDDDWEQQD